MFTPEQNMRLQRAAHAMQSGVAADQARGSQDGSPKHLRVGVNTALVEISALGRLLIAKGVVNEHEYCEAMIEGMEAEVRSYEEKLSREIGTTVKLA